MTRAHELAKRMRTRARMTVVDNNTALLLNDAAAELERMAADAERLRETLRAIQANAEAWHGPASDDNRRAAALAVIARWAREPESVPNGVREAARAALEATESAE